MKLGQFSVSLAVKDLNASQSFYQTLGFKVLGGDPDHGYVMMKQGDTIIGLFQGMFDHNILTFNPGWDSNAQNVDPFDDVRDIQAKLLADGIDVDVQRADPNGTGPAHFILHDPDGNVIMVDQHR